MSELICGYFLIGFVLVLQHSYRFYVKNKIPLELIKYTDVFNDGKLFYFTIAVVWPFGVDFLIDVPDYNKLDERVNDE